MNTSKGDKKYPLIPNLPKHLGIIMDGNGRWAKLRGKRRIFGHEAGVLKVRELVETCVRLEIEALTLYTFSSENWSRPVSEVNGLMKLFERSIEKYTGLLIDNKVSFKQVGDSSLLPEVLQRKLNQMEAITSENQGLKLTLAIGYGAQQDIIRAVKLLIDDIDNGMIEKNEIDETKFSKYLSFCLLYTSPSPRD